jgi:hypothetical protein
MNWESLNYYCSITLWWIRLLTLNLILWSQIIIICNYSYDKILQEGFSLHNSRQKHKLHLPNKRLKKFSSLQHKGQRFLQRFHDLEILNAKVSSWLLCYSFFFNFLIFNYFFSPTEMASVCQILLAKGCPKNVHLFSPYPYLRDHKYHYNFNNLQCEGSQAFDSSSSCHSGCITSSSSSSFFCLVYIIQTDLGYKVSFIERRVTCNFCPSTKLVMKLSIHRHDGCYDIAL